MLPEGTLSESTAAGVARPWPAACEPASRAELRPQLPSSFAIKFVWAGCGEELRAASFSFSFVLSQREALVLSPQTPRPFESRFAATLGVAKGVTASCAPGSCFLAKWKATDTGFDCPAASPLSPCEQSAVPRCWSPKSSGLRRASPRTQSCRPSPPKVGGRTVSCKGETQGARPGARPQREGAASQKAGPRPPSKAEFGTRTG